VTAAEEKGGGAYWRRGCSGEGSGGVRGSLAIMSRYGSSAMVVGAGWSTCAGGGARRRRGIRPTHGAIVQLNGSGSFTRGQGRHVREEFGNGSPDCSVYARLRRSKFGEGDPRSPVKFCRVRGLGKLLGSLGKLTERLARLGRGWGELAAVAEAQVASRVVARRAQGKVQRALAWARL
jgi:hypothetical protein